MPHRTEFACAFASLLPCVCAFADPIWQNSNYFTETRASAMAESPFDFLTYSEGGNYSGLFPPRDDSYVAALSLPDANGDSSSHANLRYSFAGNILSISGSVSADVDPGDFMIGGTAAATSALTVLFDLPAGGSYRIADGYFGGTHASSAASLIGAGPDPIFTYDSILNQASNESGPLDPGPYRLEIGASANSDFFYFNGLFADATFTLDIEIIANTACPGDLNADGQVDDADFSIFVVAYDILDCADPAMPAGCPADLNGDLIVDDADFSIFVVAYDALLCP